MAHAFSQQASSSPTWGKVGRGQRAKALADRAVASPTLTLPLVWGGDTFATGTNSCQPDGSPGREQGQKTFPGTFLGTFLET